MRHLLLAVIGAIALLAGACGDDDDGVAPTTTENGTTTSGSTTTTTRPQDPTENWQRYTNPDGFDISYPESWHTNDGSVTTECSLFDPSQFTVPESTDERVAEISARVDDVGFADVAAPDDADTDRAITSVDGHQAVRTVGPGGELYPEGTEITQYVIDLALGVDDGPGTLFVDVVDLPDVDYERAVNVLDRMVRTIDLTVPDEAPENVVARYEGAAPFSGALELQDGEPCIVAPTRGDPQRACFTPPGPDGVRGADLSADLFDAFGGVAGDEVFRIDLTLESSTFSYLPVGAGRDVRGFVAPVSGVRSMTWYALDGTELGTRSLAEEAAVDPIGEFGDPPDRTDDFPASGDPAFLQDVRVAGHDGFDRIVFEFDDGADISYEVRTVDEVRAGSGEQIAVEGSAVLQVTMAPASAVDLSGDTPRPTYTGPEEITPTTTAAVGEVTEVEDFESTLTWAIGLDRTRQVAASMIDGPPRLVIGVRT